MANKLVENLKRCPAFDKCSWNLCPLDYELELRTGNGKDRCRYMRKPQKAKINGRDFISGGSAMPDEILVYVPEKNIGKLNSASQKRLEILKKNAQKTQKSVLPFEGLKAGNIKPLPKKKGGKKCK